MSDQISVQAMEEKECPNCHGEPTQWWEMQDGDEIRITCSVCNGTGIIRMNKSGEKNVEEKID
jgi:DnaJ-class molecular chaperone